MTRRAIKTRLTAVEKIIQPATRVVTVYKLDGQYYEGDPGRGKRVPRAQIEAASNDPRVLLVVIRYEDVPPE